MQIGWIIGVARKSGGRIDAGEYDVAIADMTMALNAVRRLVGRGPETHVWVKEPLLADAVELETGGIRRLTHPTRHPDRGAHAEHARAQSRDLAADSGVSRKVPDSLREARRLPG